MEFDKSRVYTALNADELKVGSKVIFANSIQTLKSTVERVVDTLHTLKGICDESYSARFFDGRENWYLVYLIEEPKRNSLEWTDLKIGDVITNGRHVLMVTEIDKECEYNMHIYAGTMWLKDIDLEEWEKVEADE